MKLVSWNINGIRTLPQYHPWNTLKTCDAILQELGADIACFQEMKITRSQLTRDIATPENYDAFISLPISKGGYSGVTTYTKSATVPTYKAEEGLSALIDSKLKPNLTPEERISPYSDYPKAHELELMPDDKGNTPSDLMDLDSEGRAIVLDCGRFVLINTYCPNEGSEERLPFKMNYHLMLDERVRKLILQGRQVIVVGDINICAAPIDHVEGNLGNNAAEFWDHPARAWFKKWIGPDGPMIDVIRRKWPERQGMFTCWNTRISARSSNYGTRIDYVLVTKGLLPWVKDGDILPDMKGSDHCPIFVEFHDELEVSPGKVTAFFSDERPKTPPRLCAKFWPEFSRNQKLLSTFFSGKTEQKQVVTDQVSKTKSSSPPPSQDDSQSTVPLEGTQPSDESLTPSMSYIEDTPNDSSSAITLPDIPSHTSTKRTRDVREDGSQTASSSNAPKKKKSGQTKIGSFFGGSSSIKHKDKTSKETPTKENSEHLQAEDKQFEAEIKQALQLSMGMNSTINASSSSRVDSKATWSKMFAPIEPPRCTSHNEPCQELTTTKQGPNKGKNFWICSRPLGPGYDMGKSKRARQDVDPQYRCDFFKWSSEVKKAAMRSQNK